MSLPAAPLPRVLSQLAQGQLRLHLQNTSIIEHVAIVDTNMQVRDWTRDIFGLHSSCNTLRNVASNYASFYGPLFSPPKGARGQKCNELARHVFKLNIKGIKITPIQSNHISLSFKLLGGWLRCCATSRKDAGSIPYGVIGILIDVILPAALQPWG